MRRYAVTTKTSSAHKHTAQKNMGSIQTNRFPLDSASVANSSSSSSSRRGIIKVDTREGVRERYAILLLCDSPCHPLCVVHICVCMCVGCDNRPSVRKDDDDDLSADLDALLADIGGPVLERKNMKKKQARTELAQSKRQSSKKCQARNSSNGGRHDALQNEEDMEDLMNSIEGRGMKSRE